MSVVEILLIEAGRTPTLRFHEMESAERAENFARAIENNYARCSPGRTISVLARVLSEREM